MDTGDLSRDSFASESESIVEVPAVRQFIRQNNAQNLRLLCARRCQEQELLSISSTSESDNISVISVATN